MDAVTVDLSKSRRISSIKSSQQRMTGGTVSSFNANPAFIMRPWLILLNGDAGRPMMAHGWSDDLWNFNHVFPIKLATLNSFWWLFWSLWQKCIYILFFSPFGAIQHWIRNNIDVCSWFWLFFFGLRPPPSDVQAVSYCARVTAGLTHTLVFFWASEKSAARIASRVQQTLELWTTRWTNLDVEQLEAALPCIRFM